MSNPTEKVMKRMHEYIHAHGEDINDKEGLEKLVFEFVKEYNDTIEKHEKRNSGEMTAEDYLYMAADAESKTKAFSYVKKALELDPDNIDAKLQYILLDSENIDMSLKDIAELKEIAAKEIEDYFEKNKGDFWQILETRPYLRVCEALVDSYVACGKIKVAIKECQNILSLNYRDNLGIRSRLMHLYACLEDETRALALHRRFDNSDESNMLLPLSVLYYKLNNLDEAEKYLKRLADVNPDTESFFKAIIAGCKFSDVLDTVTEYGYEPFTIEELVDDFALNTSFFITNVGYINWADMCLKKFKKKPKKKTSKNLPKILIQ